MANIQKSQLHDFVNGEVVNEAKLDQNFEVIRIGANDTNSKVNVAIRYKSFVASANQVTFDISDTGSYYVNTNAVSVYKGTTADAMTAVAFTQTSSTIITLTTPATANDIVTVFWFDSNLTKVIDNPTFTGHVTVPEPTNNSDATTKAYVDTQDATKLSKSGGTMTGALTLSGAPTDNLHASTKKYVDDSIYLLTNGSPELLNTIDEIAAALGDDPNFATTITNQLALKATIANPTFTGTATMPTTNFAQNQALNLVIEKSATPPTSPVEGQMWYDTVAQQLKVYRGAVKGWTNVSSKGAQIKEKIFTTTVGQTVFDISSVGAYEIGSHTLFVFKNKGLLTKGVDYSEASSTTFTLTSPASAGETVDAIWFENDPEVLTINVQSTVNRTFQTSTAGQTNFVVAGGYQVGLLDVYMNGVRLQLIQDFTASDGVNVVLNSALTAGQELEFVAFDYAGVAPAVTSFNGRGGNITLTTADVTSVGGATQNYVNQQISAIPVPIGSVIYAYKNLGGF